MYTRIRFARAATEDSIIGFIGHYIIPKQIVGRVEKKNGRSKGRERRCCSMTNDKKAAHFTRQMKTKG